MEQWLDFVKNQILIPHYGIDPGWSKKVAELLYWFVSYGLNPQITSGYRSQKYQDDLIKRWKSGDKSIVVKPAARSMHSYVSNGKPAARAIDISTSDPRTAAAIAEHIGIKPGLYFQNPDRVHFQMKP